MNTDVLVGALTHILTVVALGLLYWFLPPRMQDYSLPPGTTLESLRKKYYKLEVAVGLIYVAAFIACMPVAYWIFRSIGELFASYLGEHAYLLTPVNIVWFLPAAPASVFLARALAGPLVKRIVGARRSEFLAYQEMQIGRIARMNMRQIYIMFFLPALLIAYLFVDTYVILRKDEIVIDPMLGLTPRSYAYSDIERILASPKAVAPNGNIGPAWRFVLYFNNGYRWNCKWEPSGKSEEELKSIAAFISGRSGVPIETVPVMQRADQ